jgi:hypothetical protein
MTAWGIHRLGDMIAGKGITTQSSPGVWVRAVPLPYTGARIKAAWMVLTGRAYAVQWPEAGDLERALER